MSRRFASAASRHPLPAHAVGEVVGEILDRLGGRDPDLVVVFATDQLSGVIEDIVAAIHSTMDPAVLIGSTAVGVVAAAQEIEEGPALSIWSAVLDGTPDPVRITARNTPDGTTFVGVDDLADRTGTLVLLADPFTMPIEGLLTELEERAPELTVIGGLASAARGPGGNRLVLGGAVHEDGVVAALVPPTTPVRTVVSQGCRPIGRPMTVTGAEGSLLLELAGTPALERLQSLLGQLSPEDRQMAAAGLHIGRVIDEHRMDFERGDFLVRGVRGAVPERRAIAVGDRVAVGETVQFQVRDAASADDDLRAMLSGVDAQGALLFTCNGRGESLFGQPHHDAALVATSVDHDSVAGMFCAGEIGPIGSRAFLHGFTASIAMFGATPPESSGPGRAAG